MISSKRRYSPESLAAHGAAVARRARQIRNAYEARARSLAPVVNLVITRGHVTPSEIAAALNARGVGRKLGRWTPDNTDRLLRRLIALGLVRLPDPGPLGSHTYSSRPRASPIVNMLRAINRQYADEWALALNPIIQSLAQKGLTRADAIAVELNRRGIAPRRADQWSYRSVKNLLDRLKEMAARNR